MYEQGDYLRAAGEYQRYLFFLSEASRESEQIRYKIALCYRFAGENEQAIRNFEMLLRSRPQNQFANRAYYQIGATYFLMDEFEQSARFLRETLPHITDTQQRTEAEQLIGLSHLMQKQWSEAGELFKALKESDVIAVQKKGIGISQLRRSRDAAAQSQPIFSRCTLYNCPRGRTTLYGTYR